MPFRDFLRSSSSSPNPTDPHEWKLPHRFPAAPSVDKQPQIPAPAVFKSLSLQSHTNVNGATYLPCASELAVHLCLLECFHKFKKDAVGSEHLDVVFEGLVNPKEQMFVGEDKKKGLAYERQQVQDEEETDEEDYERRKWQLILKLAVARFEQWWQKIEGVMAHAAAYAPGHQKHHDCLRITKDYLPPLDVLMVWYCYILDTVTFELDCSKFDKHKLFNLNFPWKAIHDTIDRETFDYKLTKSAQNMFRTYVKQSPDFLTDISKPPSYSDGKADRPMANLFDAIQAQEGMIQEAHRLLWIRSPALQGSLQRALCTYETALPTLLNRAPPYDQSLGRLFPVTLAWYTHRLHPSSYRRCAEKAHGAPPPDKLETTSKEYSAHYKRLSVPDVGSTDNLSTCLCWTCEAIKSATNSDSPSVRSLNSKQQDNIREDLGFHLAAETARATGQILPLRKDEKVKKKGDKKEDKWEMDYGIDYYTVTIPAKYDKAGNLVKKEEKIVKREGNYVKGFMWTTAC